MPHRNMQMIITPDTIFTMKTLAELPKNHGIEILFTDIDDTLTNDGQLGAPAYEALWRLQRAGIKVIPVTGRPAGWCEMIARLWPVDGVVGENGALYYRYHNRTMIRHYVYDSEEVKRAREKLNQIEKDVLKEVPGAAIASDQFCRLFDLAVDFCEDVPALNDNDINKIVSIFKRHGAQAKVSSIHVNGWFGDYDKFSMCESFAKSELSLSDWLSKSCFVGDSPNDEPLFENFKTSFAVANIKKFEKSLTHLPSFVSNSEGGVGFVEIVDEILKS